MPDRASAQAVVTDDAYVASTPQGQAKQNFGNVPDLRVSASRTTYLRFQLPSVVPDGTPAPAIEHATLQLFVNEVSSGGRLDVFAIQDAWNEGTISGDTAPAPATLIMTTDPIGPEAQSHFLALDLTRLVGMPNQGIAIVAHTDASGTPDVAFDSKENSQTSHEPRLFVQIATAGGVISVGADAPLFVANGSTTPQITLALRASDIPPGSTAYIQNGTALQVSNFNVGGVGAASVLDAGTQFNLSGERVLANPGNSNLFVGRNTGTVNAGGANTFVGNNAGSLNTTAIRNTFLGADAGRNNTSGGLNTLVGTDAGKFNTDGFDNAFMGDSAGRNNVTGKRNIFIGRDAAFRNVSGDDNTFVGTFADFTAPNTTGGGVTLVGAGTTASPDITNSAAIGFHAQVTTNNTIVLGGVNGVNGATSDTVVAIGTTTPQEKLDVWGGNILIGSPGRGLILRSPAGTVCRRLSINDEGTLLLINVPCPAR